MDPIAWRDVSCVSDISCGGCSSVVHRVGFDSSVGCDALQLGGSFWYRSFLTTDLLEHLTSI
jgi:hypothetical protein